MFDVCSKLSQWYYGSNVKLCYYYVIEKSRKILGLIN